MKRTSGLIAAGILFVPGAFGADFNGDGTEDVAVFRHVVVTSDGDVSIGSIAPDGALDVSSTTGGLVVPRMTTTERNALSPVNGTIIYNTTTNFYSFFNICFSYFLSNPS